MIRLLAPLLAASVLPLACEGQRDAAVVTWGYDFPSDSVLTAGDVTPPTRLDVVFDERSGYPAWGGDASVEHASATCDDMGGTQEWHNDGDYRLVCRNVDY